MDLVLNNLQSLICHKTNQTKPSVIRWFIPCIIWLGFITSTNVVYLMLNQVLYISSSSSCHAISSDILDPLSPPLPIVHRLRQVPRATPRILTELLYVGSSPARLVRLTWIIFVMGSKWPYSYCFVGCYLQDLLVQ